MPLRTFRFFALLLAALTCQSPACTAIASAYGRHWLSGRNFDWQDGRIMAVFNQPNQTRLAEGLPKAARPLRWRSRYGSITLDMVTDKGKANRAAAVDGLNEKGLSVAVLELDQAQYPVWPSSKAVIGSAQMGQYWLDRYATVDQVLESLRRIPITASIYDGKLVPLHYVIDDAVGHHAVIEYIRGKLEVYSGAQSPLDVLTNTPYALALKKWQKFNRLPVQKRHACGYGSVPRFFKAASYMSNFTGAHSAWGQMSGLLGALSYAVEPPQSSWPTQWQVVRDNETKQYCVRTMQNQMPHCFNLRLVDFKHPSLQQIRLF